MFSAETKQRADSRTLLYRRVPDKNVELISSLSSYIVDLRQPGACSLDFISVINCFRISSLSSYIVDLRQPGACSLDFISVINCFRISSLNHVRWPRSIHAFDNQTILIVRRLVIQQRCWPISSLPSVWPVY